MSRKRVAILISGRGSNMTALIDAAKAEDFPAEIVGVFSNKAGAPGLAYARAQNVPTEVLSHKDFDSREAFDAALEKVLDGWGAEIVCHAGFMRILSDGFATRWTGRMLNIHPSLLPSFPGLKPHQQALDAGVTLSGATVHFVTPDLDAGPTIVQAAVPVLATDDADALSDRILVAEHQIYPQALAWLASGQVRLEDGRVVRSADIEKNPPTPYAWPARAG